MRNERIYLAPPNVGEGEQEEVRKALSGGWVAPVGPSIDKFEEELAKRYVDRAAVALNSGTSALHLALVMSGVKNGDTVLVSSFTFAACANVVLYLGAKPVFIDSERETWNLDPNALSNYLASCDHVPKALIVTHLYGMPAKMKEVMRIAKKYGVIVIEDAAEALGAKLNEGEVGQMGDFGILSFNGNKIITTSGGGALICKKQEKQRAIYLATQANNGRLEYDHHEVGYNYRMSNILAGLGLAQLTQIDLFLMKKKAIFETYQRELNHYFDFLQEPQGFSSNRWLTTCVLKSDNREVMDLIHFLDEQNIETRRLWKPLHLHQAYDEYPFYGNKICEDLFNKGICLPSGTGLTEDEQGYVIETVSTWFQS